jgi:hypothetical protein
MKQENKIPELDLVLETIEINSETRKIRLTRRNTFYHGITGKAKCIYYWLKFRKEKRKVSFSEWLDEPVAYKVEPPTEMHFHHDLSFDKEIEKELEHYLIDEVAKERKD